VVSRTKGGNIGSGKYSQNLIKWKIQTKKLFKIRIENESNFELRKIDEKISFNLEKIPNKIRKMKISEFLNKFENLNFNDFDQNELNASPNDQVNVEPGISDRMPSYRVTKRSREDMDQAQVVYRIRDQLAIESQNVSLPRLDEFSEMPKEKRSHILSVLSAVITNYENLEQQ
jgi:hypothetical protein